MNKFFFLRTINSIINLAPTNKYHDFPKRDNFCNNRTGKGNIHFRRHFIVFVFRIIFIIL